MATDDGLQTTDEEGKTRNQVMSHQRARRRGSRLSRDRWHPACKERMLGIRYAASTIRLLGESFAFAYSNNSLAIKERMLSADCQ